MSSKQKRRLKNKRKLAQLTNNERRVNTQNAKENVVLDESIKRPFTEKVNYDSDSPQKIDNVNYSLIDYLNNTGESTAAFHVQKLMMDSVTPVNIEQDNDNEYTKKILKVNTAILDTLNRIREESFDEQDTSIKLNDSETSLPMTPALKDFSIPNSLSLNNNGDSLSDLVSEKRNKKSIRTKNKTPETNKTSKTSGTSKTPNKKVKNKKLPNPKKISKSLKLGAKTSFRAASKVLGPAALLVEGAFITYDAIQGWDNASESLGIDEKDLTMVDKSASALSSVINGITFGMVENEDTNSLYKNISGKNDVINRYDDQLGIIDYDVFGDSEVDDWDKLGSLHPDEIQKIIDIDDWSKQDREMLVKYKKISEDKQNTKKNDLLKDVKNQKDSDINKKKQNEIKESIETHKKIIETLQNSYNKAESNRNFTAANKFQQMINAKNISINNLTNEYNKYQTQYNHQKSLSDYHKNINDSSIKNYIKSNEGLRLKPYPDNGAYSIGYGHQIKPNEKHLMNGITQEQAEQLFEQDFETHKKQAEKIPGFTSYSKQIQNVLIDMTYNMGGKWYKNWPNTMNMLQSGDYDGVAKSILKSKYADDVGKRALTNAAIISSEDTSYSSRVVKNNVISDDKNIKEISDNAVDTNNKETSFNDERNLVDNTEKNVDKREQMVFDASKDLTESQKQLYHSAHQNQMANVDINSVISQTQSTNQSDNSRLLDIFV